MPYRSLNPDSIVRTVDRLRDRVHERFVERGLASLASELSEFAHEEAGRAKQIAQPNILLRFLVTLLVVATIAGLVWGGWLYRQSAAAPETEAFHLFQGIEALINMVVLAIAGVFFLATLETRIKRNAILSRLSQLRSIAHIIDMHQLTKDPTVALHGGSDTSSSPVRDLSAFELLRYLDYCAEMLSLSGKLAAIYLEYSDDSVVIGAVGEFENLTTDLTQKVWQKITVLESSARFQNDADTSSTRTTTDRSAPDPAQIDLPGILE